jgi:hypothetical protein
MKLMKIAFFLTFLMTLILVSGCKEDDDKQPPQNSGVISGQLKLSNEFGHDLFNYENMKVLVQTGEFGMSTASGAYRIENLSPGDYNLVFEKAGFGTYKRFAIKVTAGSASTTLNGIDHLGQKSTTEIDNLSVVFNVNDSTFTIGCDVNPLPDASHPRSIRLFFSKTPDVNYQDYLFTPGNTWTSTVGTGTISGYERTNFYSNGFAPSDSVYVIAYGESIHTNTYTDPATNKKVYPNINIQSPSNVAGFILP